MSEVVAVIPARGGSKGIPRKNLLDTCGIPLLAWSILQAKEAELIDSIWVSSDSQEILSVAKEYGANVINRPADLSGDEASSESAWLHGLDQLDSYGKEVELVVGMQATSPVREPVDLDRGIEKVRREGLDSLLSVVEAREYFLWRTGDAGPESVSYDYQARKRRQLNQPHYLENGSFYVFRPETIRRFNNRLGGRIGIHVMESHKGVEIDSLAEAKLAEVIMQGYGLDNQDR